MRNLACILAVAVATSFAIVSIPMDASAAPKRSEYAQKKAECERRAKQMKFGIHFIKRNRWVKECIAGKHPA